MRLAIRVGLFGALSLLVGLPAVSLAAPAAARTVIGTAAYDPDLVAIRVPYEGEAPTVTLFQLSPTHYYYEFSPARLRTSGVQHHPLSDALQRYTMANRPTGEVVRLSFVLRSPATPTFQLDRTARRVVILPMGGQPVAAKPSAKPTPAAKAPGWAAPATLYPHRVQVPAAAPKSGTGLRPLPPLKVVLPHGLTPPSSANSLKTVIGRPYLDDFHHRLVMPFNGPAPEYQIQVYARNPRWVYLDFDASAIHFEGERFDSFSDPVFDGWMLTQPQGGGKARLYLKFKRQMPVSAQVYAESGEIWFSAGPGAEAAPAASPAAEPDGPLTP